ncbi:hypothetical protein C8R46DRAFT_1186817 [Mycena filopes]|nr:hypothetical protein C8R46DRAFT_1186817 [Mycena filopes]
MGGRCLPHVFYPAWFPASSSSHTRIIDMSTSVNVNNLLSSVPKLTGSGNHGNWKFAIAMVLRRAGLWSIIQEWIDKRAEPDTYQHIAECTKSARMALKRGQSWRRLGMATVPVFTGVTGAVSGMPSRAVKASLDPMRVTGTGSRLRP